MAVLLKEKKKTQATHTTKKPVTGYVFMTEKSSHVLAGFPGQESGGKQS